jgi:asparagine synthase (glutamine-hydrolysing)
MCGITAVFSPNAPFDVNRLHAATRQLTHRGPDGQLTWVAPDGCAGVGHTRLDITTAATPQPIASEDGQLHIVANGEFYDYARLRHDLITRGHRFCTETDSEVALHLYEEMGAGCLQHLRGEFAFVIWDTTRQTLFAARDRFGIKPLFYGWQNGQLWLASEAKGLFAAGLPAAWDEMAVYQRLFGCYHNERSLFANVQQLPPAHTLTIGRNSPLQLTRYWDVNFPIASHPYPALSETALVDQIHDQLLDAVMLRTQAHVPVGCLLSGGLDSSTALAMACAQSSQPVTAFTIAFDEAEHDESSKARQTADYLGANLHIVYADDSTLADHFADAAYAGEMLQVNAHGVARWLLSRAIQNAGYRTVLAGEGADELFAGYWFVSAALGSGGQRKLLPLLKQVGKLFKRFDSAETQIAQTSPAVARLMQFLPLPDRFRHTTANALSLLQNTLNPQFAARFANYDPYWQLLRTFRWRSQILRREPAKQLLYLWLTSIFANYHLAGDRLDMAHAVEVRLPFLDHQLFDAVGQIPTHLHAQQGHQKYLLRRVAARYLPDEIAFRAKRPFYAPPITLRPNSRIRQLTADTLHSQTMATLPFFDQQAAIDLFERSDSATPQERGVLDPLLLMLVSICHINERFNL